MTEQTDKPEYIVPTLNKHGMTEFHMAAYHGDLEWIQDCLARGLDTEMALWYSRRKMVRVFER